MNPGTWNISTRIRPSAFAAILVILPAASCAQVSGLPSGAPAATATLDALANTPGLTINTAKGCCPPPTLWDFLGIKQIKQHCAEKSEAIHELPLVKSLTGAFGSVFQAVGLAEPPGPPGPGPGDLNGAGGPGAGGEQGPGAVAAKIEADKQAASGIIQNLNYLAGQDCNRYPEVVPAILQELDNPDELVRYTALVSLKKHCTDFRCSTLPATRIMFRLHHQRFEKVCGCCSGCQCQEQVIVRLTELLLDRNALGRPKETSFRIRELASILLADCLENRGRDTKQLKRRVEPDPERGPLPDPEPTTPKTLELMPQVNNSQVPEQQLVPAGNLVLTPVPDQDSDAHSGRPTSAGKVAHASYTNKKSQDSHIQATSHVVGSGEVDEANLSAPTNRDPEKVRAAIYHLNSVVRDALKTLNGEVQSSDQNDSRELEKIYADLCVARMKLAMLGQRQAESDLLEDAEMWYLRGSSSPSAVVSIASVCRLSVVRTKARSADRRRWILLRARFLTFAAKTFSHDSDITATHLLSTAKMCHEQGLLEAEQACLECVVTWFPDSAAAATAQPLLSNVQAVSPSRQERLMPSLFTDQTHGHQKSSDPPANPARLSLEIPNVQFDNTPNPARDLTYDPTRIFNPLPQTTSDWITAPQTRNVDQLASISSVVADSPALSPQPDTESVEEIDLNSSEPWFQMKQLPADVYDRAFKALLVNEETMCIPECDDDPLKPYNNRAAIPLASFSMFNIENAQPGNVLRLRYRTISGYQRPDRSEYLWSRIGLRGPRLPESGLNVQDFVFYNEMGADTTSVYTEIPVRMLNPEVNSNTAGPGDMVIGAKTILINDSNYRISTIFKTTTPVGVARRGLGTGFLSLEAGLLAIWRIGRSTHLHGEAKFHFPIGADPLFSGEVIRTGFGLSHILWSDRISPPQSSAEGLILSSEILFTSFLDGQETLPTGAVIGTDLTTINHHIGLRRMWSKRFSTGIDFGYGFARERLYDFSLLTEFQWLY